MAFAVEGLADLLLPSDLSFYESRAASGFARLALDFNGLDVLEALLEIVAVRADIDLNDFLLRVFCLRFGLFEVFSHIPSSFELRNTLHFV